MTRFSPLLLAQAHYRLGRDSLAGCTPEDIVQETWAIALPKLPSLDFQDRTTPIAMKFLSTIVLHRVQRHLRAKIRESTLVGNHPLSELADEAQGMLTSAIRRETVNEVLDALERLPELDRDIIVLRLIEQRSGDEVARQLDLSRGAVYVRQHRAVAELRQRLPESLFKELDDDNSA